MIRTTHDHFIGCLLGGACGDALGWPAEFNSIQTIIDTYGPDGITELQPGDEGLYEVTDDTQMTLFTAEGLLRAWCQSRHSAGIPDFRAGLMKSYRSWLATQDSTIDVDISHGWLYGIPELHNERAPGRTCLAALYHLDLSSSGIAENDSKGCGGVMRVAPAGLFAARVNNGDMNGTARLAFELGCMAAALTHGHPTGYYPAGVFAAIIAVIICGGTIEEGASTGLTFLDGRIGSQETIDAVQAALDIWKDKSVLPSAEAIESLGGGWVAEEALAIGIYCALCAGDDFVRGVRLAVNHSGDSDSTGSITGNILGALLGQSPLPSKWLKHLELRDVITRIGEDLFTVYEPTESWCANYPVVM